MKIPLTKAESDAADIAWPLGRPAPTYNKSLCCKTPLDKLFIGFKSADRKPLFRCNTCKKYYKLTTATLTKTGWDIQKN
jgi:hypothetical protein